MSGLLTAGYAWARDPMRFLCPDSNELDGYDRFETLDDALAAAIEAFAQDKVERGRFWAGPVTLTVGVTDDVVRKTEEWRPRPYYLRDGCADPEFSPSLN